MVCSFGFVLFRCSDTFYFHCDGLIFSVQKHGISRAGSLLQRNGICQFKQSTWKFITFVFGSFFLLENCSFWFVCVQLVGNVYPEPQTVMMILMAVNSCCQPEVSDLDCFFTLHIQSSQICVRTIVKWSDPISTEHTGIWWQFSSLCKCAKFHFVWGRLPAWERKEART